IVNTNPATASLNLVVSGMSAYYSLKTEREKHGLTSNEEFFLDSTQATVIATGLVKAASLRRSHIALLITVRKFMLDYKSIRKSNLFIK
ncbi:hypothetical protein ACVR08_10800, partial [Streptococcus caballi]